MKKNGSITAAMSLMMLVILALLTASIQGAETVCGRLQAVNGIQAGMYSLFSEYDRELWEQYHLFFLDGGYGQKDFNLGRVINHTEYFAEAVLKSGVTKSSLKACSVDGFSLAADRNGEAVRRQIIEYMKENLGSKGIQLLREQTRENKQIMSEQRETQENGIEEADLEETEPMEEISAGNNPLDIVKSIRENGILGLALPAGAEVSAKSQEEGGLLSKREKRTGREILDTGNTQDGFLDKLLLQEYILDTLSSFTEKKQEGGLEYQLEYVAGGKNSDRENLQYVVNRLLLIREASNLAYLYTSPEKRGELQACAAALSFLLLIPEGMTLVQAVLAAGWAYIESLCDVKILLSGGRVPLKKDALSWKTSLRNLGIEEGGGGEKGMRYKDYMRIILSFSSQDTLTLRCMDMIEQNMRTLEHREGFSFDCCIETIAMSFQISGPGRKIWNAERIFSYYM